MPFWFWVAFHGGVLVVLAIDLFGFNRKAHVVTIEEATIWSVVWVVLSLGFNLLVWKLLGGQVALDFLTGYVVEYSLSVDNIFVFVIIFAYFRVRRKDQHRILLWGIIGALLMRGSMIWLGVELVERFDWILYVFGLFLVATGIRMLLSHGEEIDLQSNFVLRFFRRKMRVTSDYHGQRFVVKQDGVWMFTPLAVVLLVIDIMDLIFAVDSIPAVFAITQNRFIIYTSNICAIVGLRSLYFVLAHLIHRFIYLKTGLALVLSFVGAKMIAKRFIDIPNWVSLVIIVVVLATTIFVSMRATRRRAKRRGVRGPRQASIA